MLKSADGLLHQWFIDFNNNSILDPDEIFFSPTFNHPSVWINYTFTPVIGVNVTRAGSWEYLCTFHGYAMFGRITINQAPDFTLSASPNSVSLKPGSSANSTITLTSLGSFSGLVNLSSIANSTSLSVSLNISSLQLATDGFAYARLTLTGSSIGDFTVKITGTSGSISHIDTMSVTVTPTDFTLTASPASLIVLAGESGSSRITVSTSDGFGGTVKLSAPPTSPHNLSCAITPASVTLGTSESSTLSCNGAAGTYTIIVKASSNSLTRSITLSYTIQDFNVTVDHSSLTLQASSSGISSITITSLNGFQGKVDLKTAFLPHGLTMSLDPAAVMLLPGASEKSTLTVSTGAGSYGTPLLGNYTAIVSATGRSLSHTAAISIVVIAPPSNSANLLTRLLIVGGVSASGIVASVIVLLLRRRRSRTDTERLTPRQ